MTVTSTAPSSAAGSEASRESFLARHYFLLKRLHSLSGIVPIGAFLGVHLLTNSSIVWGAWLNADRYPEGAGVRTFQHEVDFIHSLPFLIFIEIGLLWLPIAFHALFGVWIALSGRSNLAAYRYGDNWRYVLQRWSGYVGVLFIFFHVSTLRWGWTYGGLIATFDAERASSTTAQHLQQGGLLMAAIYLVCVLALVFHLANGLWTAAITWGLTISVAAQRRWGCVCAAVGIALAAATVLSVVGFATLDVAEAARIESAINAGTLEPAAPIVDLGGSIEAAR
ncbi:MAG TPA: hypothetical protein PKC43_11540 [Phycisphaerales bacterium]|nr:hypothetical protein [Phycisphaerales bacterium]HMP38065.1 hypothetical protein [Phycisphaerales bacterium]